MGNTPVHFLYAIGYALLSGCFLALSFPQFNLYFLAWIAFIPLFFATSGRKPFQAFLLGCLCGLIYFGGTLYWITISLEVYGNYSRSISLVVLFLLVVYLSAYIGLFSAAIQWLEPRVETQLFFVPGLWVVLEWIKGHFLSGFPWASLAYSQTSFLPIIQIADFGSIYAVGFVMMLVNRGLYLTIRNTSRHNRRHPTRRHDQMAAGFGKICHPLTISSAIFLLTLVYGYSRLAEFSNNETALTISVIQGNIPQDQKWDRTFQEQTIKTYEDLSLSALEAGQKPDLILWPEAALPFIFGSEPAYETRIRNMADEKEIALVLGAPSMQRISSTQLSLRNSAFYFSPGKTQTAQYDKLHLVPFGEYIPFAKQLDFVEKLVEGPGNFQPGESRTLFNLEGHPLGTVICFEVIFPEIVRQFVQDGAVLMNNITNDAWFGASSAPFQHFSMVVFRAIENRVAFARAANTGISGFINPQGMTLHQTRLFTKDTATAALPVRKQTTFYTRWGDFFVVLCGMITGITLITEIFYRRKHHAF